MTKQPPTWCALGLLAWATGVLAQTPPYFTDVTDQVGLTGAPGFRLSVADVNGDGYPDLLIHRRSNWSTGEVKNNQFLYLNVPGDDPTDPYSRKFVDFTAESGIRANRQGTPDGRHSDSGIFADVDNDGDLDLFTLVYVHDNYTLQTDRNELLLNDGQGHFTLAPNSPFHLEPLYNSAAAVFVDYDNDGNVDLFVGNWYFNDALTQDQLYQGHGDGSFTNVTDASGIGSAVTSVYGVASWDWNDDGYADLFAPSYSWTAFGADSIHWRNNGDGTFTQVQDQTGYNAYTGFLSTRASFGSMPADFDNDGDVDYMEILTHGDGDGANGVHTTAVANVDGVFSWDFYRVDGRAAEDPDITHHGDHYSCWFDFDSDGLVDFALTESGYDNNRIYLFRQDPDHTFHPETVQSGINEINDLNLPPHNVIALDYDLDGDQDLLVGFANNTDHPRLYRNDVGTQNHWLVLTLEGGGTGYANRSAIGARVRVTAGGLSQTREVYAGPGHHGPQAPLSLHFGLGGATTVDEVWVRWPNATLSTVTYTDLPVDRFLRIRELCTAPGDPANLRLRKEGGDVVLTWDAPAAYVWDWHVYRDSQPDPSLWGPPHARHVTDADAAEEGIQYRDSGAVSDPDSFYYLVTAVNDCGESPLR